MSRETQAIADEMREIERISMEPMNTTEKWFYLEGRRNGYRVALKDCLEIAGRFNSPDGKTCTELRKLEAEGAEQ
jgi:hypothetical protein